MAYVLTLDESLAGRTEVTDEEFSHLGLDTFGHKLLYSRR